MTLLPEQLSQLESLAETWALPTELQRSERRWATDPDDFRGFYDAMQPVLDQMLDYLDRYEPGNIPEPALPQYRLALALCRSGAP